MIKSRLNKKEIRFNDFMYNYYREISREIELSLLCFAKMNSANSNEYFVLFNKDKNLLISLFNISFIKALEDIGNRTGHKIHNGGSSFGYDIIFDGLKIEMKSTSRNNNGSSKIHTCNIENKCPFFLISAIDFDEMRKRFKFFFGTIKKNDTNIIIRERQGLRKDVVFSFKIESAPHFTIFCGKIHPGKLYCGYKPEFIT